jgi:hypothetical protein
MQRPGECLRRRVGVQQRRLDRFRFGGDVRCQLCLEIGAR